MILRIKIDLKQTKTQKYLEYLILCKVPSFELILFSQVLEKMRKLIAWLIPYFCNFVNKVTKICDEPDKKLKATMFKTINSQNYENA